jgi:hypothetical protein
MAFGLRVQSSLAAPFSNQQNAFIDGLGSLRSGTGADRPASGAGLRAHIPACQINRAE